MLKKKIKLPNKILVLQNADKKDHQRWYKGRDLLDFPVPCRMALIGAPNTGKSLNILNVLLRSNYKDIFLTHPDPLTKEWDNIKPTVLEEIPKPDQFRGEVPSAYILDDLPYQDMSKSQKSNLERLCGYVSTHKLMSIFITSQTFTILPIAVRRMINVFVIFRSTDLNLIGIIARRVNLPCKTLTNILNTFTSNHQSLWIDRSANSPAPYRIDGYQVIDPLNYK